MSRIKTATTGDAPQTTPDALVFMGIQASIEPFEVQRFEALSRQLGHRLTFADAPGWGRGGRLNRAQRIDLRRGVFDSVVSPMVAAAEFQTPALGRGPILVIGYSMGASLAVAAAAAADITVGTLVLVEPVAIRRWNPVGLVRAVQEEDKHTDTYLERNPSDAWKPWDRRGDAAPPHSWGDITTLGWAISRGGIPRDLQRAARRGQPGEVHLVRASNSRLCLADDLEHLGKYSTQLGIRTTTHVIPGHHQVWQSLPDVVKMAQRLDLD